MQRVDDILIEHVFAPLAGWFEHRLRFGQWRVAIACLDGHVALYLGGVAFTLAHKGAGEPIFADLLAALVWLLIMDAVRRAALRQAGSSLGVQSARFGERHFRLIFLAAIPLSLASVKGWASGCYGASLLLLLAHLYFKACDTPPPPRRRAFAFGSS